MAQTKEKTDVKKDSKSDDVKLVIERFEKSWNYTQSNYHTRWNTAWSLYNNKRVKRAYQGISNTFVPMTFSTIETMVAALFGNKPKFDFIPPQEKADQNTDILNALLDYYWDKDKWSIKVIKWGRGMLREGTSVVYLYWDGDHPCMVNVPIRDFFIDPNATDFDNARYMGRRFLTTIDELKSFEVVDPETGEMTKKYTNLDNLAPGTKTGEGDQTDKQQKDMFYGSTDPDDENQVEVIEYWTEDKVISVANREFEIENTENYYKAKARQNGEEYPQGVVPFAPMRDYTDESLFYAKGEVDVIADQQELLNDNKNQKNDSISYILNQMYTLDPKYAHLLDEVENIPGAIYLAEQNALMPIQQRPVPSEAFVEEQNIKNEIREATASNEVVKGVGQDEKTTATEVNAQIAGAGQRLALKVTQIEDEGFHTLAQIVFQMVKRYVTEPMLVRVVGKDGTKWEEFNPEEFLGEYEPRVQLSTTVENRKQEDAAMAKEMFAALLNDPDVNQVELKKIVLSKAFDLDPDEVGLLVQPQAEMMGMEPSMGGMIGEEPSPEELPPEMLDEAAMEPEVTVDPETGEEVIIDPATGEMIPVAELLV